MSKIEMDVYVLSTGKQTRYGGHKSKMMADVNGKPAFSYTMDMLTSVFPEDRVTVITSSLYPDLNDFINSTYPKSKIKIDSTPGNGTMHSLSKTFPWRTKNAFVTEGDIYFMPDLIKEQTRIMKENPGVKAVIGVTPHVAIAPTHREINVSPQLEIAGPNKRLKSKPTHKNIGAHTISSQIENLVNLEQNPNVIDVIRYMHSIGETVIASVYLSTYLHLANHEDIQSWEEYFHLKRGRLSHFRQ